MGQDWHGLLSIMELHSALGQCPDQKLFRWVSQSMTAAFVSKQRVKTEITRMWANAQRDGRPAIPNGNEPICLDSAITKGQAAIMLMSFIYRHHLTNMAVEDLLDLLSLLCPGCLPSTRYLLTKGLCVVENHIERHMYCNVCFAYVSKYADVCDADTCRYCDSAFN